MEIMEKAKSNKKGFLNIYHFIGHSASCKYI